MVTHTSTDQVYVEGLDYAFHDRAEAERLLYPTADEHFLSEGEVDATLSLEDIAILFTIEREFEPEWKS